MLFLDDKKITLNRNISNDFFFILEYGFWS